ncbi:hypothetical protein B0H12DRAFT_198979 [Mycena haematopus]|nr:hypothetical protein B0H12DRAFT_198979 [Mycena haematopus]
MEVLEPLVIRVDQGITALLEILATILAVYGLPQRKALKRLTRRFSHAMAIACSKFRRLAGQWIPSTQLLTLSIPRFKRHKRCRPSVYRTESHGRPRAATVLACHTSSCSCNATVICRARWPLPCSPRNLNGHLN